MTPQRGQVLYITKEASVQFARRPIMFRVIRIDDRPTYHGWVWLDGYQLDSKGYAVSRREIFVMLSGLRLVRPSYDRSIA